MLEQSIYFIEGRAVLIFRAHEVILERYDVFITCQFGLQLRQFVHHFLTFPLVIEIELFEQVVILRLPMLQVRNILGGVGLNYLIVLHKVGLALLRVLGAHLNDLVISNYLYKTEIIINVH